ncbi:hypothetical protein CALCODRAFT_515790 [Calocera cornea HHB12733]|uniref:RNI-like protein n=1 Tax=Calocera cornea HHB12733 TaxID=1353952 RepID=A0A165HXL4_9BASI|nr:hypothetical protein CALCODRAFT_515790 [Calocera cornea HHB12733]
MLKAHTGYVLRFLQCIKTRQLRRFSIRIDDGAVAEARDIIRLIASRWPDLLSMSIELGDSHRNEDLERTTINHADLAPLTCCRHLQNLGVLGAALVLELSDSLIADLAAACPEMESLYLVDGEPGQRRLLPSSQLQLTAISLVHLAKGCTKLKYVGLAVQYTESAMDAALVETKTGEDIASRLTGLDLCTSIIDNVPRCAALLTQLFPYLATIDCAPMAFWSREMYDRLQQIDSTTEAARVQNVEMLISELGVQREGRMATVPSARARLERTSGVQGVQL